MMAKVTILIAFLSHLLCITVQGQLSRCSKYFSNAEKSGPIFGRIEIPSPPENEEFYLRVALDTTREEPSQIFAQLELARSVEESLRSAQQGGSLLYNVYFVSYFSHPTISAIWFNNRQYCEGPEGILQNSASGNIKATIELGHIIYLPNEEYNLRSWHRNSSNYRINNPSDDRLNYLGQFRTTTISPINANNECGITNYYTDNTNRLMSNGEKILPGQWPWVVTLFIIINDILIEENLYMCTGSVLTTRHVITVVTCLKLSKSSNDTIDPNNLYVAFGHFTLSQRHDKGTISRKVASYIIHPDYVYGTAADSDLAILILSKSVEYNAFIKPVCLWTDGITLRNVVNKTGYVIGWGEDYLGRPYTKEARITRVPIVSQEECLWDYWTFRRIISNRTFCAGFRDGSSPCNSDIGSGLVLFDATTNRYRLRGVVSRLLLSSNHSCDTRKYVVYVDVAKYVPWIQQQISNT